MNNQFLSNKEDRLGFYFKCIEQAFDSIRAITKANIMYTDIEKIRDIVTTEIEYLNELGKQEPLSSVEYDRIKFLEDYVGTLSTFYVYTKELEDIVDEFPIEMLTSVKERVINARDNDEDV